MPGNKEDETPPQLPRVGRKPTREDLTKAAEAARNAAEAAGAAAAKVAEGLSATETPPQGTRTPVRIPAAEAAGGAVAFEAFMAALQASLKKAGANVTVNENAGWVRIEGVKNGQKLYIAKTKTVVHRVECTLPADLIEGAEEVPVGSNGKIASRIPPDPQIVAEAIKLLATSDLHLRPRMPPSRK